ncbi:hypothetical protein GOV11_01205 [Candidatus Woesearchaeota archaeon]|nr:hypothetical protein [Candidatus Woesearchaeota archaeon]
MSSSTSFHLMRVFRILYGLIILKSILLGDWPSVLLNGGVFLATLPIPLLGKKRFYALDAYLMAVFTAGVFSGYFGIDFNTVSLFSADKWFHLAGGFGLGWLFLIIYKNHVKPVTLYWLTVLLASLAIGAGWEIFEWTLSLLPEPFYLYNTGFSDSMLDIIYDTIGSILAVITISNIHLNTSRR